MSPLSEWTVYRTRFLVRARQLESPLVFVDALGREHSGRKGDYLVESSDGTRRIAPREIFEDIYVAMNRPDASLPPPTRDLPGASPDLDADQDLGVGRALDVDPDPGKKTRVPQVSPPLRELGVHTVSDSSRDCAMTRGACGTGTPARL